MLDIIDRFDWEFNRKKNPQLIYELLNQLLNMDSAWVMISTFSDGRLIFSSDNLLKLIQVPKETAIGNTIEDLNLYAYPNQYLELKKRSYKTVTQTTWKSACASGKGRKPGRVL